MCLDARKKSFLSKDCFRLFLQSCAYTLQRFCNNTNPNKKSPKRIFTRRVTRGRDTTQLDAVEEAVILPLGRRTDTFATNFSRASEDEERSGLSARTLVNPARHVPRTRVGIANFLAAVTHCVFSPVSASSSRPFLPTLLCVHPSCVRVVPMMRYNRGYRRLCTHGTHRPFTCVSVSGESPKETTRDPTYDHSKNPVNC